jgi:hypothetical protein
MQGQILEVDVAAKTGTILGDDGNRYGFTAVDWRAADVPGPGVRVDFVPGEGGVAREIFPLPGAASAGAAPYAGPATAVPPQSYPPRPPSNNSQMLGWIGIACLVLGFVLPILLPTIAAFILGLIGADSAKRHNDSTGLTLSRIAWIGAVTTFALGMLLLIFAFAFVWPFFTAVIDAAMEAERSGKGTNALIVWLMH